MFFNFILVAANIKGKELCKKRKTYHNCKRQETVERDILITSRHDNKKLNKLFRIITGPPTCNRKWN